MTTTQLYRRIRRRETHASRSRAAATVAVLAILALAWLVVETVLAALGARPLLLSPTDMVRDLVALPTAPVAAVGGAAVVLALLGLLLVVLALTSGRLGRHVLLDERAAVVVDDEVVASALVRAAADASGVDPDRAVATVGRRTATVRVTPTSGDPLDRAAALAAVNDRLEAFGLVPSVRGRIVVTKQGQVGA